MSVDSILVVEDEDELASLLRQMLREFDVSAVCARSSEDALEFLEETQGLECVAVLADLNLGATEKGTALLAKVRTRYPHLLRMLITGWVTAEVRQERREGCVEFLIEKPWTVTTLSELIAWVQEHRRVPTP